MRRKKLLLLRVFNIQTKIEKTFTTTSKLLLARTENIYFLKIC